MATGSVASKPISSYTGLAGTPAATAAQRKFDTGIPGFDVLSNAATQNISDLLSGSESPAITQNMNAMWGVNAGVPGTDFLKGRAIDLYGQRSQARKEQGLADLLNMMQGYSGTVVAKPGEILSSESAAAQRANEAAMQGAQLGQQASQFGQTMGFEKEQWNKQLELLDQLLKQYGGGGGAGYGYNPNTRGYEQGWGNVGGGGYPSDYSLYTNFLSPTPASGWSGTMYGGPAGTGNWPGINPYSGQRTTTMGGY